MKQGDYQKLPKNPTHEKLESMWTELGDTPIDEYECIDIPFYEWEKGTECFEIWHWFEEQDTNWIQNHF